MTLSPILLEIVEGTIESSRKEMELQVERTARSTIIREQHDYRAAVFDRRGRGISAVSSAANVDPILDGFSGCCANATSGKTTSPECGQSPPLTWIRTW